MLCHLGWDLEILDADNYEGFIHAIYQHFKLPYIEQLAQHGKPLIKRCLLHPSDVSQLQDLNRNQLSFTVNGLLDREAQISDEARQHLLNLYQSVISTES